MQGAPAPARESVAEYMRWVAADASRHHRLKARIQKYIDNMNACPDRRRIRDADSIRNHQELTVQKTAGRRLVDRSQACIPVDKWSIVRPNQAMPGEEFRGWEMIKGEWTNVEYALKDGATPHLYDIENYDDSCVNHKTRVAELQDDDGSDEDREMQASLAVAMKAVTDKSTKAKAISLTALEDLTCRLADEDKRSQ